MKNEQDFFSLWRERAGFQWADLPNWWVPTAHNGFALKKWAKTRGCPGRTLALTGWTCHRTKATISWLKSSPTRSRKPIHSAKSKKWVGSYVPESKLKKKWNACWKCGRRLELALEDYGRIFITGLNAFWTNSGICNNLVKLLVNIWKFGTTGITCTILYKYYYCSSMLIGNYIHIPNLYLQGLY